MQITTIKDLAIQRSLFLSEVINDYEFNRMTKIEKIYIISVLAIFLLLLAPLPLMMMIKNEKVEIVSPHVIAPPQADPIGDLDLSNNSTASYDRYWGKTQ